MPGKIILLIIVVALQRPLPPDDMPPVTYTVYLPAVYNPVPLIPDNRPGPEVCMAWSPGTLVDRARADFGSEIFFHSSSYQPLWISAGGIPVWRSPNQPGAFVDVAAALRQQDYHGIVMLFNEPDIPGQDGPLAPTDAAALYRLATTLFPGAVFVTPNANSTNYLAAFLAAVGDAWRPQDRIGVHMYQPVTGYDQDGNILVDYPTIWPNDWLQPVYGLAAARGSKVWVTEVGPSNEWTPADLQRYYRELLTSDTEAVCVYTPNCGGYSPHACKRNLYDSMSSNPSLTLSGLTLLETLQNP